MAGGPPPRVVDTSPDGEGFTVRDEACGHPRAGEGVRGLPDELPDEPLHLPLNADRVLRRGGRHGAAPPESPHVMPCDRGRTGQAPFCDHSGTSADHDHREPEPAGRPPRGAPDG
ncbi:hypothetical protein JOC24_004057 [Streptomyces sp. HB132]|nr:hypothetical protein [Streptomyces sp. HB132]